MSTSPYAGTGGPLQGIGRPLRVMIVEDEALIAMDLEMTLEDLGAEVVCKATSASEAVRLARQHRPDCATMDINIHGDRDGVSAAIELYQMLGVRSIFVSAYGNPETRERATDAKPIGWISKPFSEAELKRTLDEFSSDL
ncbi:response regulator (plasmid) [Paracoccus liaowanqingii]|uniref:Response regulator n=2 Tax=Paracoccus liaowanqingii TaxID=2560053 RepID=A0A4Y5SU44_9RHOB|nr:response regulator [Paracoccus liaowanqingii]